MLNCKEKKTSLKRTNPLLTHNIPNSKRNLFSPHNVKTISRQNMSTSPSPNKHSCLTPRLCKNKKTPSKLFKIAHETGQRQTYLQGNSTIENFLSSAKVTVFRDTVRSHPKEHSQAKLTIQCVYNICIHQEPTPRFQSLSQIIRQFESVQKQNGLANITQNSEDLLEINSKVEESRAQSGI